MNNIVMNLQLVTHLGFLSERLKNKSKGDN